MPAEEIAVDEVLVRRLLTERHPDLADATITHVDSGWDNTTWRLGTKLAARIPRRQAAVPLIENEQRWLPIVSRDLTVAVPEHVRIGTPTSFFPWPWSVVRWLPGVTADVEPLAATGGGPLGETLATLHQPAPTSAPTNPYRGIPLRRRHDFFSERLAGVRAHPDLVPGIVVDGLADAWASGLAAPESARTVWIHGDLHPRNVLVAGGRLVGLIDWGDLTAGDAATDLAAAWTLLSSVDARRAFWSAIPSTDGLVDRSRAWAALFGLALFTSGERRHAPIGHRIMARVAAG